MDTNETTAMAIHITQWTLFASAALAGSNQTLAGYKAAEAASVADAMMDEIAKRYNMAEIVKAANKG